MEDATSTEAKLSSILLKKPLARDETPWLGGFFREALRVALEGHDPLPKSRILNLLANASREGITHYQSIFRYQSSFCQYVSRRPAKILIFVCLAEWREIFGYCGILETCAVLLPLQQDQEVIKHSMRLIGNCCADTGELSDAIVFTAVYNYLLIIADWPLNWTSLSWGRCKPGYNHSFRGSRDFVTLGRHQINIRHRQCCAV